MECVAEVPYKRKQSLGVLAIPANVIHFALERGAALWLLPLWVALKLQIALDSRVEGKQKLRKVVTEKGQNDGDRPK